MGNRLEHLGTREARVRLVLAFALLGVLVAAVATLLATPQYRSTATVLVSISDPQNSLSGSAADVRQAQPLVNSYANLATSDDVMLQVVDGLQVPMTPATLASKISVSNPPDTTIIAVSATDPSPETAQLLATATTDAFVRRVTDLEAFGPGRASGVGRVAVVQAANLPSAPASPRTARDLAVGLLAGLAVGGGAVLLLRLVGRRPSPLTI